MRGGGSWKLEMEYGLGSMDDCVSDANNTQFRGLNEEVLKMSLWLSSVLLYLQDELFLSFSIMEWWSVVDKLV